MRRQERDATQVKPAVSEHREDRWEPPRGSPHPDAQVGLRLREVEDLEAVVEHRGACLRRVEPAMIDLGNMSHDLRFGSPRLRNELRELMKQVVV